MHSDIKKALMIAVITYLTAAMIISPHTSVAAAQNALRLCGSTVIPSIFPFIFCSNMFIALGAAGYARRYISKIMMPLFGINGCGAAAFVLGILSGYPIGGICASELYSAGECTKREVESLTAFCNNSGPMFVIGAVGLGMFRSQRIGILLYTIHIVSAIISGIILKYIFKEKNQLNSSTQLKLPSARYTEDNLKNTATDIGEAVIKSVNTILMICGFVVIFAVIASVIPKSTLKPYFYLILEITGGISEVVNNFSTETALILVSAAISFSGISVLCQVMTVLEKVRLSIKPYIIGKSIQSLVSAVLMWLTLCLNLKYHFNFLSEAVFKNYNSRLFIDTYKSQSDILINFSKHKILSTSFSAFSFGILIIFCIILICYLKEKFSNRKIQNR